MNTLSTPRLIASSIPDLLPMVRTGDPKHHVSYIIRSLCVKLGHLDDDSATVPTDAQVDDRHTLWGMGSAWEEALIAGLRRRYERSDPARYVTPGELVRDGLIGSPDLLDMVDCAVEEIKFTFLSSNNDPMGDKFWKYWVQTMAYAHMMGDGWCIGRVHAAHIRGDYSFGPPRPQYRVWERRFTKFELESNWRMLRNHGTTL